MITTFLFDLDGTLLPMDQDCFIKAYIGNLAQKMASYGYEPSRLIKSIWAGTEAMARNDGSRVNEDVFWDTFSSLYGKDVRQDEPIFLDFYQNEFQNVKNSCGFDSCSKIVIDLLKKQGIRIALATNPLFPAVATHSRIRWAGLKPEDFEWITTYENSRRCKPNPDYYRDILDILKVRPEECVMVGNDVTEDMVAAQLGMQVFLLTDCLINKHNADISQYPHGDFEALLDFIGGLNP